MLIFLDTEFTRLPDLQGYLPPPSLISIGLVAEDGREYYAETTGWRACDCNRFVKTDVLPLLTGPRLSPDDLRVGLVGFLAGIENGQLVCDFGLDLGFLTAAVGGTLPKNIRLAEMSDGFIREKDLSPFFDANRVQHHALNDARALRLAYLGWKAGVR